MKFQAIKGVRDILPPESALWNRVEQAAREVFQTYGYGEIRLPIFEPTELFARSVGVETDIVSKEMYNFEDKASGELAVVRDLIPAPQFGAVPRSHPLSDILIQTLEKYRAILNSPNTLAELPKDEDNANTIKAFNIEFEKLAALKGSPESEVAGILVRELQILSKLVRIGQNVALRPEATASVVRAYIQNGMHTWPTPVKLYYIGPMFRRERPQKGRYRQFYQIGAELLGPSDDPSLDAEVIEMLMAFFARIRLTGATLFVNSIGDKNCRPKYVKLLQDELQKVREKLGADSQRRIETNPLRVLDSKIPEEQPIIEGLPRIGQYLCADCKAHYSKLIDELNLRGIDYKENWRLVRGLEYYTRTTFEITAAGLGSQNAVCGGGRYDGLVELLGGPASTKGIGFAIGTDRVVLSLQSEQKDVPEASRYELAVLGTTSDTWNEAVKLAESLRRSGAEVFLPRQGIRLKQALEQAAKFGVRVAIIVGEDELKSQRYTIRVMQPFYEGGQKDSSIAVSRARGYAALVQVRAELERKLKTWAAASGLAPSSFGISALLNSMREQHLLPPGLSAALKDVLPTLNEAAHGREIDDATFYWALAFGYLLLAQIDKAPLVSKTLEDK
jgi:histidyl-tRNA synthetase